MSLGLKCYVCNQYIPTEKNSGYKAFRGLEKVHLYCIILNPFWWHVSPLLFTLVVRICAELILYVLSVPKFNANLYCICLSILICGILKQMYYRFAVIFGTLMQRKSNIFHFYDAFKTIFGKNKAFIAIKLLFIKTTVTS